MTTIQVYRNRRNSNKYIEVHNDGHYHNSLKQYLYGYYTTYNGVKWLYITVTLDGVEYIGFSSKSYLKK